MPHYRVIEDVACNRARKLNVEWTGYLSKADLIEVVKDHKGCLWKCNCY